jgi:hypothetical protein
MNSDLQRKLLVHRICGFSIRGFVLVLFAQGCDNRQAMNDAQPQLSPQEVKAIAKESFFWNYHQVAFYHFRYFTAQMEQSPL